MFDSHFFMLIRFLSFSPICRITDDRYFGEVRKGDTNKSHIRISVFSFNFGDRIVHILTYSFSSGKFSILYLLRLSSVQPYPDLNVINTSFDKYKDELSGLTEDKYLVHKETLMHKITELEATKNRSFNKFVAYLTVTAFIIPLFSKQFSTFYEIDKIYQKIFILILIYQFLNLTLFFYKFIKVQTVNRVTFRTVRKSEKPIIDFIMMLYYDWRSLTQESTFQVTIIKNIEKFMISIICTSILLMLCFNMSQYLDKNNNAAYEKSMINTSPTSVIHIEHSSSFDDFLTTNKRKIAQIEDGLLDKAFKEIILISGNLNDYNYRKLMELFNTYNIHNIEIIEVVDYTISDIKIVILKERK